MIFQKLLSISGTPFGFGKGLVIPDIGDRRFDKSRPVKSLPPRPRRARPPGETTLLDIIEAYKPDAPKIDCSKVKAETIAAGSLKTLNRLREIASKGTLDFSLVKAATLRKLSGIEFDFFVAAAQPRTLDFSHLSADGIKSMVTMNTTALSETGSAILMKYVLAAQDHTLDFSKVFVTYTSPCWKKHLQDMARASHIRLA